MKEEIEWQHVNDLLPDDEMTVLLYHPTLNEPVWLGYYFEYDFFSTDGIPLPDGCVTHWADLPYGHLLSLQN
jgi:hypothetical protein